MIYPQREAEPAVDAGGEGDVRSAVADRLPWRPDETPLAIQGGDPSLTDLVLAAARYVAVDRIDGALMTIAVAFWPAVDPATARLDFGPRAQRRVITVDTAGFQTRADADRTSGDQLVRPIRVGDVFLVLELGGPVARWGRLVDVTRAGRLAAKAALFSTVAPAPSEDAAPAFGLGPEQTQADPEREATSGPGDEAPPPGPVAYPAV